MMIARPFMMVRGGVIAPAVVFDVVGALFGALNWWAWPASQSVGGFN